MKSQPHIEEPWVSKCWAALSEYYFNIDYRSLSEGQHDFIIIQWGSTIRHELYGIKSHLIHKDLEEFKEYFKAKYTLRMRLVQPPENLS